MVSDAKPKTQLGVKLLGSSQPVRDRKVVDNTEVVLEGVEQTADDMIYNN